MGGMGGLCFSKLCDILEILSNFFSFVFRVVLDMTILMQGAVAHMVILADLLSLHK